MRDTRDSLAGIVAEFWTKAPIRRYLKDPDQFTHDFGGDMDTKLKVDFDTVYLDGSDFRLDVKASSTYPNCLVGTNHPAFNPRNMQAGQRAFVFPFRERKDIVIVRVKPWFHELLKEEAEELECESRLCYIVKPDLIFKNSYPVEDVDIIETSESFGSFFDRKFPGNPIKGMSRPEIIEFANETIASICKNDDIP